MLRQVSAGHVGNQAGEVDEASDTLVVDGIAEVLGRLAIGVTEVRIPEPVDEVDHGVDAGQRQHGLPQVEHVHPTPLHPFGP